MRSRELPQVVPRRREAGGASERERRRPRRLCRAPPRRQARAGAAAGTNPASVHAPTTAAAAPSRSQRGSERSEQGQHPGEGEPGREREREREPRQPGERLAGEREGHVDRQHAEPDERQPAAATRDEDERERHRVARPTATMYGDSATTSRPIWAPTSSLYALPSTRPAISAPATAKIPAVALTTSSAGHDEASTCRAMRSRVETESRERYGRHESQRRRAHADDGRGDQVRVAEARDRPNALPAPRSAGRRDRSPAGQTGAQRRYRAPAACGRSFAGRPGQRPPASARGAPGAIATGRGRPSRRPRSAPCPTRPRPSGSRRCGPRSGPGRRRCPRCSRSPGRGSRRARRGRSRGARP